MKNDSQKDILTILADAISDVGYWSYWLEQFPNLFQLEFGGVLLWNPPIKEGKAPSGQIALLFQQPYSVDFLTFSDSSSNMPPDWPQLMSQDKLELPHGVSVLFNDQSLLEKELADVKAFQTVFGFGCQNSNKFFDSEFQCFVRAGDIGVVVCGKKLNWRNHTENNLALDLIPGRSQKWWKYWRAYWDSKETANPFPKDYACEVTIPAGP